MGRQDLRCERTKGINSCVLQTGLLIVRMSSMVKDP